MKPKRVRLSRVKGSKLPPNTVVVCRPSKLGNPFRIGYPDPFGLNIVVHDRYDAVAAYSAWIEDAVLTGHPIAQEINKTRGKNVACWCPLTEPCHGDVILKIANTPAIL